MATARRPARRPPPRRAARGRAARLRADPPALSDLPERVCSSGRPGCRSPRSSCSTRWPRTATYTSGCHIPPARSGTRCPGRGAGTAVAAPETTATTPPVTRCWQPSPATSASCSGRWPESRRRRAPPRCPRRRTRCSAGCRTTCAATPSLRPDARRAADDRSVQVHACHGAARQVEVLREVLLGMLESDPTLEPRDILVMCPDIETFAPLITAGFGLGACRGRPPGPSAAGAARRPVARARPTRCWASRRSSSTSPAAGPPPARSSTSRRPSRCAAASASPTTTSTRSPPGSASPGFAGPSTASTATPFGLAGYQQNTWRAGLDRVLSAW